MALHLPVMTRCVWRDSLSTCGEHFLGEHPRPVARPIIGDDALDRCDSVLGELGCRPIEEAGGGRALFVVEGCGVGESSVPVDGRVEIGVSTPVFFWRICSIRTTTLLSVAVGCRAGVDARSRSPRLPNCL